MKTAPAFWYRKSPKVVPLLPLVGLYRLGVGLRRLAYRWGLRRVYRPPVPLIVVGNLTVGGTGKTPLVAWLANRLREAGYAPGVVSRGYGGRSSHWPQQVRPDSDPAVVGDEPVLLARHCGCPVAVGPDRVAAIKGLLAESACDIVLSDDGLQHYRMGRDLEILVVDAERRFGNGFCLPAGPLREPLSRAATVDLVVANGGAGLGGEYGMWLTGEWLHRINDAATCRHVTAFRNGSVHAVAGIGHPQRFFDRLRRAGLTLMEHPFPDHHPFRAEELAFEPDAPVLMTEKDAIRCERFASDTWWYLPVAAELDGRFWKRCMALMSVDRNPKGGP